MSWRKMVSGNLTADVGAVGQFSSWKARNSVLVSDIQKGNPYTLSCLRCGHWIATGSLESPDYTSSCVNSIGLYKQIHFCVISWNGLNDQLMSGRSSLRYNSTYEDDVQEGFYILKNQAIVSLPTWLGFQYVHINQKPCRIFG